MPADRAYVDIEGLRLLIEQAYPDNPAWQKLSMAQKIRLLLEERLKKDEDKQP